MCRQVTSKRRGRQPLEPKVSLFEHHVSAAPTRTGEAWYKDTCKAARLTERCLKQVRYSDEITHLQTRRR